MLVLRDKVICVLIYFLLSVVRPLKAEKCGGLLEADNGHIEVEPCNSSCLWIIKLKRMMGIRLEIKLLTVEAIVVIPFQNNSNANLQSTWIAGPSRSYPFEGKMFAIFAPPRAQRTSVSWTGVTVDSSDITSSAKFLRTPVGTLQWERTDNGMDQTFWAFEHEATGQFNWTLNSDQPCCGLDSTFQCISFDVIHVMQNGSISNINNTCPVSSVGSLKVKKHSKTLALLHMNPGMGAHSNLQVTWKPVEHLKRNVKGVMVATKSGLYVVGLNPSEKFMVSAKETGRVAFDWKSKKIYWDKKTYGIMRANVDGSNYEQIITEPFVTGIQVEPITGNLYYGTTQRNMSFRVSSNNGEKCSTIANLKEYVYGIAFHSSKGLLFWSGSDTGIFRANLDGSNATAILQHNYYAIRVDEQEDRMYFSNRDGGGAIMSSDLNGHDVRALGDISNYSTDMDVDSDKVYFMKSYEKKLYSNTKQGTNLTVLAESIFSAQHIALFGKLLSPPIANPCEKAECAHLCVLINASSYRCLCPEGEKLQDDRISCD